MAQTINDLIAAIAAGYTKDNPAPTGYRAGDPGPSSSSYMGSDDTRSWHSDGKGGIVYDTPGTPSSPTYGYSYTDSSGRNYKSAPQTYQTAYEPKRSKYSNDNDFYKAANAYRLSLLNPYTLPGIHLEDGTPYDYINVPREGISQSNDMVKPPTFTTDPSGNIVRTDSTQSGEVNHTIFNLGGWRQTSDGRNDPDVGDAYSRQLSPYAFQTRFKRGDQMGVKPSWYDPNANQSWLERALAVTKGDGDYMSLLPGDDYYSDGYGGGGGSSAYAGERSLMPSAPSVPSQQNPLTPSTPIAPRAEQAPDWSGRFWGDNIDIDAELRALGYNPAMMPPAQKSAILAAMRQLQGGR